MAALDVSTDFRRLVEALPATVYLADPEYRVQYVSPHAEELLGYPCERWLEDPEFWVSFLHSEDRDRVLAEAEASTALNRGFDFQYRAVRADGETIYVWERTSMVYDREGKPLYVQGVLVDVTQVRKAEAAARSERDRARKLQRQVAHMAYHDSLTGLPNRSQLEGQLATAIARSAEEGTEVAVLYIDLDGFKLVNDSFGHSTGDELLCLVSKRIRRVVRAEDLVVRHGGDEFLVLLADLTQGGEEIARRVGGDIATSFDRPFDVSGRRFDISASVGISLFPRHGRDQATLITRADAAMYEAKAAGRGSFAIYSGEQVSPPKQAIRARELADAIRGDGLVLHFQPIWAIQDRTLVGLEALLRCRDSSGELLRPADFLPVAEEANLMLELNSWVVNELTRLAGTWQAALGELPQLAFNASPRQLANPLFAQQLADAVAGRGLKRERFVIEITETTVMASDSAVSATLERLRSLGFRVALDDFGAGLSSLGRLAALPVDVIKIDRSLLAEVPDRDEAMSIARAAIELGRTLGKEVVAEGVESAEQLRFLSDEQCPYAQGFHLGRPLPEPETTALLMASSRIAPSRA